VVGLPRDISPGARSRRAFLADLLIAVALAMVTIFLAAGIGVVGFFALLVLLVLSFWIGLEAAIRSLLRRRRRRSSRLRPQQDRTTAGAPRGRGRLRRRSTAP
jgi:UPF0716 family protein affecting phage T7 exclusion